MFLIYPFKVKTFLQYLTESASLLWSGE